MKAPHIIYIILQLVRTNMAKTLFISDLHLSEENPSIVEKFLTFIHDCDTSVRAIYILGDLFEAWIGDDDISDFHSSIIQALKMTTQRGIPIYFQHGNRDFLINKQFSLLTGCQILAEEERIDLYGTPVLLMHGDTLCTNDHSYLRLRRVVRNKIVQKLFLLLPLKKRRTIAQRMRAKSTNYNQMKSQEIMDVTPNKVAEVLQHHQVQFLIHGHTHKPAFHAINNHTAMRIVLGAWHERGNVLIWDDQGKKEWVEF